MDWGVRTVSLLLCLGVLLATIQHGYAERKIVCYYTNWSIYRPGTAKFSPQNINPYLCTHLIYAFGGFTKDNALKPFDKYQDIEKGGYAKFTGLKTYNKNLKTLLAIGGWNEGSSRFSPMVADAERRREFVKNSIKFLRKNHFDGLDLDWEYPAFRDGGKPRDKDNYASLVQELREEYERESSKTGRPRLLLSMAMPAGIEYIDKGYDVPRLNEYLDFINLLSYDYHSSYEPAVNHHSPLYPLEEDNEYNYDSELTIDYTVSYLLKMGASPDKIILGIPTYGRSYTLFNQDATDLGSPADGPGIEGDATREKGYLAYYEICDSLAASEDWEVVQPNVKAMGPYAFKEDQWVGYDDEDIVKLKAKYANEKELGGIMFWTIDNDDFRGKCHDRPYPLIEAAKEALLSKDTNAVQRSKTASSRKKTRLPGVQSNTVGRKLSSGGRRTTTTAAPATRKRVSTPRPKFRTFSRSKSSDEEDDDQEVDRRSYEPSNFDEEEEEEDSGRGNAVRSADKADRSRNKGKSRPKARQSTRNRNKLTRRKNNENNADSDESLSNKLTTPEPPTTPDPGTDFKCEDEGFFSHPRDCKKYFWCLDSGPGGLGVVAHQFTCPSGLVFNKAADSCDYPRNVVCPKAKASQSTASTTRAPITAATSRTTYLYSTTRKPSTETPDLDEEYEEEYDDEEDVEEEEEKPEPKVTTTPKPLLYKTITRTRPTTTTTTTTETPATTTSKPESSELEKVIGLEDEEDPKVIKELIKLIKKAGGIEQLEKHLSFQNKSPDESSSDRERATPATISRTLYERVLSRQAGKTAGTNFANGPGGAQFEGLDDVPEVKNLRRLQKPQYVTIERPKPSTKEPPVEEEEEGAEEELDDDNEDVASSEEQAVSNPFLASSTQRATPNYINIRRARPSATTSRNENDVDEKDDDEGDEVAIHPRRPGLLSRSTESNSSEDTKEQDSRSTISEDNSSTTKFRYVSVQRFRSTTPRFPVTSETTSSIQEPVTESGSWSETPEFREKSEVVTTTASPTTVLPSTTPSTTTPSNVVPDAETEKEKVEASPSPEASSTTEAVKLVEDSATEILLTTAAASLSTLSSPSTRAGGATVSQPRPFGFSRRSRPSTDATSSTTPLPSSSEQARPKVASSEAIRLPTLKELIGPRTNRFTSPSPVHLSLLPFNAYNEILPRDKHANPLLQGDDSRGSSRDREPWSLSDGDQSNEKRDELDLIGGKASEYYAEDNIADDEGNALSSRRRIDREDSSTTTLKPTTMRGAPLVNLRQNQSTRGFYVTKSEEEPLTAGKTGSDSATEFSTVLVETREQEEASTQVATTLEASTVYRKGSDNEGTSSATTMKYTGSTVAPSIADYQVTQITRNEGETENRARSTTPPRDQAQTEVENGLEEMTTAFSSIQTTVTVVSSLEISTAVSVPLSPPTNSIPQVTSTFKPPTDYKPSTTNLLNKTSSRTEAEPSTTDIPVTTTTVFSNNITDSSTIESTSVPPLTTISDLSTSTDMQFDSSTKTPYSFPPTETMEPVTEAWRKTQRVKLDLGTMTTVEKPAEGSEAAPATLEENTVTQGDEGRSVTTDSTTLTSITKQAPSTIEESTEAPVTKSSRRRNKFGERSVIRGPIRHGWKLTTADQEDRANQVEQTPLPIRRVSIYRGRRRRPVATSTAASNATVPQASTFNQLANVSVASASEEDRDRVKGKRLEVNSTKSSVASTRTPGSALWTRSRKPAAFSSSTSHSISTTVASYRKNRPSEGNSSTVNEKLDATDEVRGTPKAEKESDQSGRAQEIAVTLAEPPTPRPPATGRPSFRNPLRRRISTTLAPRTDATTGRSTHRDRQKPRAKDNRAKVQQNVTSRPRRPPVIDYDYYEDEEEPVVGKSSFNGKLFLTSKGTFRCLDQGNFPHPYSCKKFITCARMVNGLVTGAEYSCPDKLSFDPVGGICNWSAGLGCKD